MLHIVDDLNLKTIPQVFIKITDKYGFQRQAIRFKKSPGTEYIGMNYTELRELVECFSIGMLNLGIKAGDRVGIISENRYEWIVADFAVVCIGAIDVPLFPILTAKQIEFTFNDCEASAVIVSNNFQLSKINEIKDKVKSLRHVIVLNDDFSSDDVSVKSMKAIIARGKEIRQESDRKKIFVQHCNNVKEDDLLTLIYTSGTTGNSKGVMLSHKNIVSNITGSIQTVGFNEDDSVLSHLPLCHSYERTTGYYAIFAVGATINLAESIETVATNLTEVKPTIMTTVPRLLETVKKRIFAAILKEKTAKQKVFYWAIGIGKKWIRNKIDGKSDFLINFQYSIADKLVFSKIRERFGGRMRLIVSGGAALSEDVHEFFLSAGINLVQGYGLTEASPVVAVSSVNSNEIGVIGSPLINLEVKIADDGEILVRGDNVMKGYWNDTEATEAAIDAEGWLYTGDVGIWTEKGNIKITDRKKNIFVNSGGKNIAPQPIENLLQQSRYIDHVILIGDRREFCTALISPDYKQLEDLANEFEIEFSDVSELILNSKIINHVKKDIDYLQKDLAKFEKVRKFSFVSQPFTIENGELSLKMSIKRHIVEKKYADMIEMMYGE